MKALRARRPGRPADELARTVDELKKLTGYPPYFSDVNVNARMM